MSHLYFPTEILERFCIDSFKNFSFSEDESKIITDVLLTSDKFGIESHGMQRISRYHKGIQKGTAYFNQSVYSTSASPKAPTNGLDTGVKVLVKLSPMQ